MASSKQLFCGICEGRNIYIEAIQYCPECEDALCNTCLENHNSFKATKRHTLILVENYKNLPSLVLDLKTFCDDHDEKYQNYCINHQLPLCNKCIITTHKDCKDITILEDVLPHAKSSTGLENAEMRLEDAAQNIKNITEDRGNNLQNIKQQRQNIMTEVKGVFDSLYKHLNGLQNDVLSRLDKEAGIREKCFENCLKDLRERVIKIDNLRDGICNMKKYASNLQVFLGMMKVEELIQQEENFIDDVSANGCLKRISLEYTPEIDVKDIVNRISSFGRISTNEKPQTVLIKRSDQQAQIAKPQEPSVNQSDNSEEEIVSKDDPCGLLSMPRPQGNEDSEMPKESLNLEVELHDGVHSTVWKGKWNGIVPVAVAVFKKNQKSIQCFKSEVNILKQCTHTNILKMIGVLSPNRYLVTELISKGNLETNLKGRDAKLVEIPDLVRIAAQIAGGMAYLKSKSIAHRDLRAGNILLTENYEAKICGFKWSQILQTNEFVVKPGERYAVKWAAPEMFIFYKVNIKSDVWSFGILLVELFSFGRIPYPGNPTSVLVVGSSIIRDAFAMTKSRPGGPNLGLDRLNLAIWWQGYGGIRVQHLKSRINTMLRFEDPPTFLVLHIAGNDIGNIKIGYLRTELKQILLWIKAILPNTVIIWSQILPRLQWRYSNHTKKMERCRYRLNNSIATFVMGFGGRYIQYPEIRRHYFQLLKPDGVHLSCLGTNILLNNLQGGLEQFLINDWITTFPTM